SETSTNETEASSSESTSETSTNEIEASSSESTSETSTNEIEASSSESTSETSIYEFIYTNKKNKLPTTGTKNSMIYILLGLGFVLTVIAIQRRRKNK
ncbi:LPXTG cell wall anchor domain-containing protein, partial [Enterococcus faecalis]|uniref:LPXTG cell wall anchor domain-containing protein n=1 Tax=Enterococcus faecalis TaxID=1351 RepID=UPI0034CED412